MYVSLKKELVQLLKEESNFITNASNFAALLNMRLENINWVGFYMLANGELLLGPFQGKPACIKIPLGKGVCGKAASIEKTVIVNDVHEFPGHIVCDCISKSEIVVPLIKDNILYGVLDIDSPLLNRFSIEDKIGLEELVMILMKYSDMDALDMYFNKLTIDNAECRILNAE